MSKEKKVIKLNLGCGLQAPSGWINIDSSQGARISKWECLYKLVCRFIKKQPVAWPKTNIRIIDVRKGLPFPDNSVYIIFSSHMLEHMSFRDANFVIRECYRCLCEGGIIRITVPDLYQLAKKYVDAMTGEPKPEHSHIFLQCLGMPNEGCTGLRKIIYNIFGHEKHLYMYDQWSLRELLEKNRFRYIQSRVYRQSLIPDFDLVEDESRHNMSICLEAIK